MFRFLELSLHGWDLWPPVRVPLARDVVLVSGPNGSGKTTLLDAIRQILNAPLSSKRRLQHYIRRPDAPALLRAIVSNDATDGSTQPFRAERIGTDVATLACALVPASGGSPEKRFAILPGRASVDEVRGRLLDSRGWYGPEQYARALEHAGVTRSLMSILATEQGRTNALFEVKPRELFQKVLEMLGERQILERYRAARRKYEDARAEVDRQNSALVLRQADLQRVQRQVAQLAEWEEAEQKVRELEERLPAADLQGLLRRREDAARKIPELRTKVSKAELEQRVLVEAKRAATERKQRAEDSLGAAKGAEEKAKTAFETATRAEALAAQRQSDLQAKADELARMPAGDLVQITKAREEAARSRFDAERARANASTRVETLEEQVARLRAGGSAFPAEVERTLHNLSSKGIPFTVLADLVSVRDGNMVDAAEAALGDARFALLVEPSHESAALAIARDGRYPGPVYTGAHLDCTSATGPLEIAAGAPEWVVAWSSSVAMKPDGRWVDARGTWVAPPQWHVLGGLARKRALANVEETLRATRDEHTRYMADLNVRQQVLDSAIAAEQLEERRRALVEQVSTLDVARATASDAQRALADARFILSDAEAKREAVQQEVAEARGAFESKTGELSSLNDRLAGERAALHTAESEVQDAQQKADALAATIRAELRLRAERGELDSADTVRADLSRAKKRLDELPSPPPKEVREEERHLRSNVEELERHLGERRKEADAAASELTACRLRYLDVVSTTLRDYRHRAVEIAARADVQVRMDLPTLTEDDRSLDEATILAEFGFDGKDPLPLGDPSFSGGQQVIAGLILLMAMAETDRRGFFILDEPFAHLSLDRIDQVGRFLRSTRSQFIITAPTTLDRAQLDPASAVIVLRKKRGGDDHAPVPVVAEA